MAEVSETLTYEFDDDGLDDLRKDMKRLTGDIEDTGDEWDSFAAKAEAATEAAEDSVEDFDNTAIDLDVSSALTSLQRLSGALRDVEKRLDRLDGQTIDVDTNVDRGRSSDRGGGARLPGELDEVGEAISFIGSLPPHVKALGAAALTATAALGAAGGLAGAATALANKFGDRELRGAMTSLKNEFRGVATTFVTEFEPVIRNTVIPALESLAQWVNDNADGMAEFSAAVLGTSDVETRSYASAATGISGVPGRNPDPTQRDQMRPNLTQQTGTVTSNSASTSEIEGFNNLINRESVKKARVEIDKIRAKMEKMPGFTRKEGLKEIIQVKKQMWATVRAKAKAQNIPLGSVDLKSGEGVLRLKGVLENIKQLMGEVDQISAKAFAEKGAQMASENAQTRPQTDAPDAAGPTTGLTIPVNLEPQKAFQDVVTEWDKTVEVMGDNLKNTLRSSIQSASRNLATDLVSIFSPGDAGTNRLKLQRYNLQQQQRQLRQSLKQREITYKEYSLRIQQLNKKMSKTSEKMAKKTESVWKKAFRSLGSFVGDIIKQVIQQLLSATIAATALSLLTGGLGFSIGGASGFSGFSKFMGMSFMADGGVVTGPTPAMIGEYPGAQSNPEIVSPESKMRDVFYSTLKDHGGGFGNITINVQGESTIEGRDIKTSYDTETQVRGRQGIE